MHSWITSKKEDGNMKWIIECERCGSFTKYQIMQNNICPECCTIGSLFINENPTMEQLNVLDKMEGK